MGGNHELRQRGGSGEPHSAKKEFLLFKKASKKTGGGPQSKPPSQSSEQIIEIFEDTPAFAGLSGFETGNDEGGGKYIVLQNKHRSCDFLESGFRSAMFNTRLPFL